MTLVFVVISPERASKFVKTTQLGYMYFFKKQINLTGIVLRSATNLAHYHIAVQLNRNLSVKLTCCTAAAVHVHVRVLEY
eukprot:SAG31_NODE_1004_length_10437_cov_2.754208_6_plen_80_part_00